MRERKMNKSTPHTPAPVPDRQRRQWLTAIGAGLGLSWAGVAPAQPGGARSAYRLLLNTGLSGPVAFVLLAQDKGYLRDEGLDVQGPVRAINRGLADTARNPDDGRLRRLIDRIVRVKRLPRTPSVEEVFDRSLLPPLADRVRHLAG